MRYHHVDFIVNVLYDVNYCDDVTPVIDRPKPIITYARLRRCCLLAARDNAHYQFLLHFLAKCVGRRHTVKVDA